MMRYLDPLLRKYGVNLMFAGHDHHYERSYPVYDGRRTTSERGALYQPYGFQAEQGGGSSLPDVIRVVVGTGGRRIRDRCDREVCRCAFSVLRCCDDGAAANMYQEGI